VNYRDRVMGIVLFTVGWIYLILAFQIPKTILAVPIDANVFPIGLGIIIIILSVILFIQNLGILKETDQKKREDSKDKRKENWKGLILVVGACFLYPILLPHLGFIILTFFFIMLISRYLGFRKWGINASISLGVSVGFYLVFTRLLFISLPRGVLPIR